MKVRRFWLAMLLILVLAVFAHGEAEYDGYVVCVRESKRVSDGMFLMATEPENTYYKVETLEEAEQMRKTSDVVYIEPNYIAELFDEPNKPNDPYYTGGQQWQLDAINWLPAYEKGITGEGVTVAVIDSGLAPNLPDMDYSKITGYNFCDDGATNAYCRDTVNHGTFVVSQIAPITNNGTELAGTASGVNLMILRCFKTNEVGLDALTEAVNYAVENNADIINLSAGSPNTNTFFEEAIQNAISKGVIVVAAVGNYGDSHNAVMYPAGYDGVIGVGSYDKTYTRAATSEHNGTADIMAPGESVYGRLPARCGSWSGTSFACPTVAAALALAKQVYSSLNSTTALRLLQLTAIDMDTPDWDENTGWGRLNVGAMLDCYLDDCMTPFTEAIVEHTPPTCTEDGMDVYICPVCHEVRKTVILKALGHDTENGTVVDYSAGDCTHDGYQRVRCDRCGEIVETWFQTAPGHDWGTLVTVPPTETDWGYTKVVCTKRACGLEHIADITPPTSVTENAPRFLAIGQNWRGNPVGFGIGTDLTKLEETPNFQKPKLFCFDEYWRPLCKPLTFDEE